MSAIACALFACACNKEPLGGPVNGAGAPNAVTVTSAPATGQPGGMFGGPINNQGLPQTQMDGGAAIGGPANVRGGPAPIAPIDNTVHQ